MNVFFCGWAVKTEPLAGILPSGANILEIASFGESKNYYRLPFDGVAAGRFEEYDPSRTLNDILVLIMSDVLLAP